MKDPILLRKEMLVKLITFNFDNLKQIKKDLSNFEWDCDAPLIYLDHNKFCQVLQKYTDGCITLDELVKWAETIEFRDDIDFEEEIKEIIFILSNQEINEPFTKDKATQLIHIYSKSNNQTR